MNKFSFLKAFFSPFKTPIPKLYIGKIVYGTPYFYPRRWVKSEKEGHLKAVPKKIGFDFVGLGWKTKWDETDYRFEWGPVWSFVFFKWQIAITFKVPDLGQYWEGWLFYERNTDKTKTKKERIEQCKEEFPLIYTVSRGTGDRERIDYYYRILKTKYLK